MGIPTLISRTFLATPSRAHIVLPLLFMCAIYWLSSLPGRPWPDDTEFHYLVLPVAQNALHIPAYAAFTLALRWALRAWLPAPIPAALCACGIATAYAIFDEWHQGFVPGRFASLADVMLDLAGIAIGIWLYAWIGTRVPPNSLQMKRDRIKPET